VKISGDVRGGPGSSYSGLIKSEYGNIAGIAIGGSLIGTASATGMILSGGALGPVKIGRNVQGGSVSGTNSLSSSGYIQGQQIASVDIGGSIISGTNTGSGTLAKSGSIRAQNDLGPITVAGSLVGNSTNPLVISGRGQAVPTSTDVAIQSVTVKGSVQFTNILGGYDVNGNPVNGSAQIGDVLVDGDWMASNIAAGVMAGPDGFFGTADDTRIPGGSSGILSEIASIVINGKVEGTPASMNATDHFGFVAELIGALKLNGIVIPLNPGPHNDDFAIGTTDDMTVLEV
jgi:hypothetical protein